MMGKRWAKWHFQDWRSDPGLRMCGLAARGLWMEVLGYMHEADGYFTIDGRVPELPDIARLVGAPVRDVAKAYAELESHGVFSRTEKGVPFSRRMLRDLEIAEEGREHVGKRWKPNRVPNSPPNRVPTPDPNTKKLEARIQSAPSVRVFWESGQQVPEAWKQIAQGERSRLNLPPIDINVAASKFEEWHGARQVNPRTRTEWQASFNNFVKDEKANGPGFSGRNRKPTTGDALDKIFARRAQEHEVQPE